jgi:outer membrane protein
MTKSEFRMTNVFLSSDRVQASSPTCYEIAPVKIAHALNPTPRQESPWAWVTGYRPGRRISSFGFRISSFPATLLALVAVGFASVLRADPLTLPEAIQLALAHNPNLKVVNFSRGIAQAGVLSAYGQFDPAIDFRRKYSDTETPAASSLSGLNPFVGRTKEDDYSLSLDGVTPWGLSYSLGGSAENLRGTGYILPNDFTTFGGISITQPLLRNFGFSSNLAALRIAKANRAISEWDYRQSVIDTVTGVIFAYDDLALAKDNLRITQRSLALANSLLEDQQKRLKAGFSSESEVIEAHARAAQRTESILIAERSVQDAANALRQILGEDIFGQGELEIVPPGPGPTVKVNAVDDLKIALAQRPDYLASRLGVQKTRITATSALNQLLPRLDFVGSYGYTGADQSFAVARHEVGDQNTPAWSAGVVVSVPITFAAGRGQLRAARLQRDQAEADLVRLERDIAVLVANAAGQIDTTQQRVVAAQIAYDLGSQSLHAEEKKLLAGSSTTFVVASFQETLTQLESNRARALSDHRKALANYDRVLGRTLDTLGIKLDKN